MFKETIFALSTPKAKSGVAVFRISGTESLKIAQSLSKTIKSFAPRKLILTTIIDPRTQSPVDDAMMVYFNSPNSFTGEDVVEIHTHGSIAIYNIINDILLSFEDVRHAEAGEFTKRAVLNGKMDLTMAEGLMDLINAETYKQHKQSLNQMHGALYEITQNWRAKLIEIMSLIEAYIDFPDEDIPEDLISEMEGKVDELKIVMEKFFSDKRRGERLRCGLKLAIFGKPNVGKSSLLNYLSKREIAIVSGIAGTTRDVIEAHLDINGYPIILLDTAGIHDTTNEIEAEGIKRAKRVVEEADIKIHLQDVNDFENIHKYQDDTIYVLNKIDLAQNASFDPSFITISLKNNMGLDLLLDVISSKAEEYAGNIDGSAVITNQRQRNCVQRALEALMRFSMAKDLVISAEELRIASRELEIMTGRIDAEEVLSEIFSKFCIGK